MSLLFLFLFLTSAQAAPQLPALFRTSAQQWLRGEKATTPVGQSVQQLLRKHGVRPDWLARRLEARRATSLLVWPVPFQAELPALALQAIKLTVLEPSDDWMKDDLYCYFFVTDGADTTGKVTSVYRGLAAEESVLFRLADRVLYPLDGSAVKAPQRHLILDYGIVESDGDDVKDLQKLTAVIVDLAAALASAQDVQAAVIAQQLRDEVKALADALLATENDDELVTSTWALDQVTVDRLQTHSTVEFQRVHRNGNFFDQWKYRLTLRILR